MSRNAFTSTLISILFAINFFLIWYSFQSNQNGDLPQTLFQHCDCTNNSISTNIIHCQSSNTNLSSNTLKKIDNSAPTTIDSTNNADNSIFRKLFKDSDSKNKMVNVAPLPDGVNCVVPFHYPGGILGSKSLVHTCKNMDKFNNNNCVPNESLPCSECIPPYGSKVPEKYRKYTLAFKQREEKSRTERRKQIKQMIDTKMKLESKDTHIVLITLNHGYIHLFLNWVCGLEHQNVANDVRQSTLVIATDEESERAVNNANFAAIRPDWLFGDENSTDANLIKIDKTAPEWFGWGAHRWIVSLQIVYTLDVISLGYNVIQQDTDIVWLKDARKFFEPSNLNIDYSNSYINYNTNYNISDSLQLQFVDLQMAYDGRNDEKGPGNSGFIRIKSNCKTKVFLETLVHYIGLVIWGSSDQYLWDIFLMEYHFRQLNFQLLPPGKFVNGHQWDPLREPDDHKLSKDIWVLHTSWVDQHPLKITKLKMLNAWFFNDTCQFYDSKLMPNHSEPNYWIQYDQRNWDYPNINNPDQWWAKSRL